MQRWCATRSREGSSAYAVAAARAILISSPARGPACRCSAHPVAQGLHERRGSRRRLRAPLRRGQTDLEMSATERRIIDRHGAAVLRDDGVHDREAQPRSIRLRGEEWLEKAFPRFSGDAWT